MKPKITQIGPNKELLKRIADARLQSMEVDLAILILEDAVQKRAETYEPGTLLPCWRHVKKCLLKAKE